MKKENWKGWHKRGKLGNCIREIPDSKSLYGRIDLNSKMTLFSRRTLWPKGELGQGCQEQLTCSKSEGGLKSGSVVHHSQWRRCRSWNRLPVAPSSVDGWRTSLRLQGVEQTKWATLSQWPHLRLCFPVQKCCQSGLASNSLGTRPASLGNLGSPGSNGQ